MNLPFDRFEIINAASLQEAKRTRPDCSQFVRHSPTQWAVATTAAGILTYMQTRMVEPGETAH